MIDDFDLDFTDDKIRYSDDEPAPSYDGPRGFP